MCQYSERVPSKYYFSRTTKNSLRERLEVLLREFSHLTSRKIRNTNAIDALQHYRTHFAFLPMKGCGCLQEGREGATKAFSVMLCALVVRGVCTLRMYAIANETASMQRYGTFVRPGGPGLLWPLRGLIPFKWPHFGVIFLSFVPVVCKMLRCRFDRTHI